MNRYLVLATHVDGENQDLIVDASKLDDVWELYNQAVIDMGWCEPVDGEAVGDHIEIYRIWELASISTVPRAREWEDHKLVWWTGKKDYARPDTTE